MPPLVEYTHPIRFDVNCSQDSATSRWNVGTLSLRFQVSDHDVNEERTAAFSKFRFGSSAIHVLDKLGCTDNRFAYAVFTSLRFATVDETKLNLKAVYKDEKGNAILPADLVTGLSIAKHNTHNWDHSKDHGFSIRLTVESYECPFVQPTSWVCADSTQGVGQQSKGAKKPRR